CVRISYDDIEPVVAGFCGRSGNLAVAREREAIRQRTFGRERIRRHAAGRGQDLNRILGSDDARRKITVRELERRGGDADRDCADHLPASRVRDLDTERERARERRRPEYVAGCIEAESWRK